MLEVDLDYPVELHKANNGYPLALEKTKIEKEWMSDYQKNPGRGVGVKPEWNKACLDAAGQEKLRRTLQKSAVLSQGRDDTPEGQQNAGIWPRVLDKAVQPDEHRIPKAGNKRIREELLQTHEQFCVRESDGERAEAR